MIHGRECAEAFRQTFALNHWFTHLFVISSGAEQSEAKSRDLSLLFWNYAD
jgi:hypothetical protein